MEIVSATTGVVTIAGACLLSFAFYQVGLFLGTTSTDVIPNLRNRKDPPENVVYACHFDSSLDDGMIPECAHDVFLTLHKLEGGRGEHSCRGMLLRDDIILTSSECSKFNFTFDFPGVGTLEATPHASLNEKEQLLDSRLGFLEANPPYHYHFIDQPVRRNRMFLSLRSRLGVNGTETKHDGKTVATCEDHNEEGYDLIDSRNRKLTAHNFPVKGELVPLGHLVRVLPEGILWEDTDKDTTYISEDHNGHRWWTRKVSLEEEEIAMKNLIEQYKGPPGSVSIPGAHSEGTSQEGHLSEALDPRAHDHQQGHRRGDCLKGYYKLWSDTKQFSGMHFFDWLDYGPEIKKIRIEKNDQRMTCSHGTVHYFNDMEREAHEIYIHPSEDGKELVARYKMNDQLVPESDGDDSHLYMWDLNKRFYVVDNTWDRRTYGAIKHSGVMAGRPALAGGNVYFGKHGSIWGINYSSGHYRPSIQAVSMMYQWIVREMGLNATALHWVGRTSWSTEDCVTTDWNSFQIPGFNASALNRSCHDVTTSPTWVLKDDV